MCVLCALDLLIFKIVSLELLFYPKNNNIFHSKKQRNNLSTCSNSTTLLFWMSIHNFCCHFFLQVTHRHNAAVRPFNRFIYFSLKSQASLCETHFARLPSTIRVCLVDFFCLTFEKKKKPRIKKGFGDSNITALCQLVSSYHVLELWWIISLTIADNNDFGSFVCISNKYFFQLFDGSKCCYSHA